MSQKRRAKPKGKRRPGGQGRSGQPASGPPQGELTGAMAAFRAGRVNDALAHADRLAGTWPRSPTVWNLAAYLRERAGQLEAAVTAYGRALEIDASNAAAWTNYGYALRQLGEAERARSALERALALERRMPGVEHTLGLVHETLGDRSAAIEAYQRALRLDASLADVHNDLGNALAGEGRLDEAESAYRHALELRPDDGQLWSNLGQLLARAERYEAALEAHRRACELRPTDPRVRQNHGRLREQLEDFDTAEDEHREALRHAPDDGTVWINLGNALKYQERLGEAESAYRHASELRPSDPLAPKALADLCADVGRTGEAAAAYRSALERDPDDPFALYGLAMLQRLTSDGADGERIDAALARADPEGYPEQAAHVYYAAAKRCDDAGAEAGAVFARYRQAATLKRRTFAYDVADDEALPAVIAEAMPGERWPAPDGDALASRPAPLFIVGMPRSGTTLVEQIMASHTEVVAGGERMALPQAVLRSLERCDQPLGAWLGASLADEAVSVAAAYRARTTDPLGPGLRYVTDKLPANFKLLGAIAAALPEARIVHVRREPADTCVSCFTTLFAQKQLYSYDLDELGRMYRVYDRLMRHWRTVLPPGRMLEIDYEALVANPEDEIDRLLAFLGLPWEAACLAFHRTPRRVATASSSQVRRPLYAGAVGRWRRFEPWLAPLLDALGPLAPERRDPAELE